jgi:hypothetical protein
MFGISTKITLNLPEVSSASLNSLFLPERLKSVFQVLLIPTAMTRKDKSTHSIHSDLFSSSSHRCGRRRVTQLIWSDTGAAFVKLTGANMAD